MRAVLPSRKPPPGDAAWAPRAAAACGCPLLLCGLWWPPSAPMVFARSIGGVIEWCAMGRGGEVPWGVVGCHEGYLWSPTVGEPTLCGCDPAVGVLGEEVEGGDEGGEEDEEGG